MGLITDEVIEKAKSEELGPIDFESYKSALNCEKIGEIMQGTTPSKKRALDNVRAAMYLKRQREIERASESSEDE